MRISAAVVLLLAAGAARAAADEIPDLQAVTSTTVFVRDMAGHEVRGKLLEASRDHVVLLADGEEKRFAWAEIAGIDRRGDSLKNGILIGAVLGAVLTPFNQGLNRVTPGVVLAHVVTWGAIGAAVDAAQRGRTPVYRAPAPPGAPARRDTTAPARPAVSLIVRF